MCFRKGNFYQNFNRLFSEKNENSAYLTEFKYYDILSEIKKREINRGKK